MWLMKMTATLVLAGGLLMFAGFRTVGYVNPHVWDQWDRIEQWPPRSFMSCL